MTRLQEWLHLARSVCLCVSLYSSECHTVYVCMWCVYEWDWFHIARGAQVADGSIWPPPGFSWVVPVRHHRIPNPSRQHHILWSHWNCDDKKCYGHNIVKEALSQVDHPDYPDYLEHLDHLEHLQKNGNVQNVGEKSPSLQFAKKSLSRTTTCIICKQMIHNDKWPKSCPWEQFAKKGTGTTISKIGKKKMIRNNNLQKCRPERKFAKKKLFEMTNKVVGSNNMQNLSLLHLPFRDRIVYN